MAKWDPDKTFVTAQRIFGGVHPFSFFLFLADVRFVYHFVLRGRLSPLLFSSQVVAGCQIAHARDKSFFSSGR